MKRILILAAICSAVLSVGQNDLDMLRYARSGVGGTARFAAMGGAFGAVGADLSAANYNPAGLALYRKSDLNFGFGLQVQSNTTKLNHSTLLSSNANLAFTNFGISGSWKATDPESRHILAFSNIQSQNFSNRIVMSDRVIGSSISKDFLNLAQGQTLNNLSNSYEGLAYDTYLMDYDSVGQQYFTFVDQGRSLLQTRTIERSGRVNDLNLSYAYTHNDKFYVGVSVGFPQVSFSSLTSHEEVDDKDSMRITMTGPSSYTSTYTTELPFVYSGRLGFNSLTYEEYFKTTGSGVNLKLGGIYRLNDQLRIGAYYHTATVLRLTDLYDNSMSVSFDRNRTNPEKMTYPEEGGIYKYQITIPARISFNLAYILGKKAVFALDYEKVNYSKGKLSGATSSEFSSLNSTIQKVYQSGHNLRVGMEYNLNPFKVRAGYVMNGNPFGKTFSGNLVRNTISLGAGLQTANGFYLDVCYALTMTEETYYLFSTLNASSRISNNRSLISATGGFKF